MIDDSVVRARIPRLGTITVGRGVEATSRSDRTYSQPRKAKTLVFHTDDGDVADALHAKLGGSIETDSPTWSFDVVTATRDVDLVILPQGFRQALELWRAAECMRRCDGVTAEVAEQRPGNRSVRETKPCVCEAEMARGAERACKPSTLLPALVELPVERFGVWEIRSNSWGTAQAIKGTMAALQMVGATAGSVPAVLSMVDRTVRDAKGEVHSVVEMQVTIARSQQALVELASKAQAAIGTPAVGELPAGDDAVRLELMQEWADLQGRAHRLGQREVLVRDWRQMFGSEPKRELGDLSVDELTSWVDLVRGTVADGEAAVAAERAEATGSRESAATGSGGPVAPPLPPPPDEG